MTRRFSPISRKTEAAAAIRIAPHSHSGRISMICAMLAVIASIQLYACTPAKHVAENGAALRTAADSNAAVHRFVQAFYDWYVPIASADSVHIPAFYYVLTKADRYLDRDLAAMLRADSVEEEIDPTKQTRETLDADPFLDSQDPCGPYEVIDVRRRGSAYVVRMRACHGDGGPVVEVRSVGGAWRISNMLDVGGGGRDLKSYFCEWAKEDSRPERRPPKC